MKSRRHRDYRAEDTELCEAALLTAWGLLDDYRDDLVLIGGLVPRYICRPPSGELAAGTLDVDLGLGVGVRGTSGHRIAARLGEHGFRTKPTELPPGLLPMAKFYRTFGALELCIEFMTEGTAPGEPRIQTLDNMMVPALAGVQRALDRRRTVRVAGRDLRGAPCTQAVGVCEIGPFLCLKLQAHAAGGVERAGKDIFDIVHSVVHYDGGAGDALAGFAAERGVNPAFPRAEEGLRRGFGDGRRDAALAYADFCLGGLREAGVVGDYDSLHAQRVEEAMLVGERLRRVAGMN